jgi:hypothetical protein
MKEFIVFTDEGEQIEVNAKDFSTAYEIANAMGFTINFIENSAENSGRFV